MKKFQDPFTGRMSSEHPLSIAKRCRTEMRAWALWWRRGSQGSTPERVLAGARLMRDYALAMEAQGRRWGVR